MTELQIKLRQLKADEIAYEWIGDKTIQEVWRQCQRHDCN
jgi:hypothetical protein